MPARRDQDGRRRVLDPDLIAALTQKDGVRPEAFTWPPPSSLVTGGRRWPQAGSARLAARGTVCEDTRRCDVLVARSGTELVEASRDLPAAEYQCPSCTGAVTLKRGRVVIAHFAHARGATCAGAEESARHRLAKWQLADALRASGARVQLERVHADVRRVDVAVALPPGPVTGCADWVQVAVEVQDTPISVTEMRARGALDRHLGYAGTVWVFTSNRQAMIARLAPNLETPFPIVMETDEFGFPLTGVRGDGSGYAEARVPEELRYQWNATHLPLYVLDTDTGVLCGVTLADVVRAGGPAHNSDGEDIWTSDRTLRSTKHLEVSGLEIELAPSMDRYGRPTWTFRAGNGD